MHCMILTRHYYCRYVVHILRTTAERLANATQDLVSMTRQTELEKQLAAQRKQLEDLKALMMQQQRSQQQVQHTLKLLMYAVCSVQR
jgi:uncharacterized coiled-coil protein SlyX